jgi:membrane protein YdbS with pleckstrin-like domain
MAFPQKLLAPGENVVVDLRPHWVSLVASALLGLVAVVVYVLLLLWIKPSWPSWTRWTIFIAATLVLIFTIGRKLIDWVTTHFVLTTERVIHRQGWLAKESMEVPLDRISDVKFGQSIFERLVGAGNLTIESAAELGEQRFDYIRRPEEVQRQIYEQSRDARRRSPGPTDVAPSTPASRPGPDFPTLTPSQPSTGMIADELTKLDELRSRGVLSEEEFQRQKARLLGQS